MKKLLLFMFFLLFIPLNIKGNESVFEWPETYIEVDVFDDINKYINNVKNEIKLKKGYSDDKFYVDTNNVNYTTISTISTSYLKTYTHYFRANAPTLKEKEIKAFYFVVVDKEKPKVLSINSFEMVINGNKPNYLKGINAVDNYTNSEDLIIEVDESLIDYQNIGTYDLIYKIKDSSSNETITKTTLTILDITPPTIVSTGLITHQVLEEFNIFDHFIINDNYDLNPLVEYFFSKDINTIGEVVITVIAKDQSNNIKTSTKTINVIDLIKPIITVHQKEIFLEINSEELDFSNYVSVSDNYDDLDYYSLTVISEIDYAKVGEYLVTFKVKDQSGNEAENSLVVYIIDSTPPDVKADDVIISEEEGEYFDIFEGLEIIDNYTSNENVLVSIYQTNYQNKPGKYYVIYEVKDKEGNTSYFTRNIVIAGKEEVNDDNLKIIVGGGILLVSGIIILSFYIIKRKRLRS